MCPNISEKETIVQSLRIDAETHRILTEESESQNVSLNSLTSRILQDYAEYGRFANRYGTMRISPTTLTALLNELSDETIERVTQTLAKVRPRELLSSLGLDFTDQNAKRLITEFLSRHHHWFEANVTTGEKDMMIHLRHRLNRKWSVFLSAHVSALFQEFGYKTVKTNMGDYSVTLRLTREK